MKKQSVKAKKIVGLCVIAVALVLTVIVCVAVARPLFECIGDAQKLQSFGEDFRAWVEARGILGRIVFVLLTAAQVVLAVIPGEPFEFAAGYAFGWLEGAVLCMAGIDLGSLLIFLFVRKFGKPFVNLFFSGKEIDELHFLQNGSRVDIVTFFLMFLPGTPKDLLSYAAGLTKMKLGTWLLIVSVARIPSVVTSTISGDALNSNKLLTTAIVYGATLLVSAVGLAAYKYYCKKYPKQEEPASTDGNNL